MILSDSLVAFLLLVLPMILAARFRPAPDFEVDTRRIRMLRAWIYTLGPIGLLLFATVAALTWPDGEVQGTPLAWSADIPWIMTWGARPTLLAVMLCGPAVASLTQVLYIAMHSERHDSARRQRFSDGGSRRDAVASDSTHGGPIRSASLAPRHREATVPAIAWALPTGLWLLCALLMFLALTDPAVPAEDRGRLWLFASLSILGLMPVLLGTFLLRQMAQEPEPQLPDGDEELADGYRRLRRFRAHGMYWTFTSLTLMASLLPLLAALRLMGDGALGIAGAGLGTAIGMLGAMFGSIASFRREGLRKLLLERHPQSSAAKALSGDPGARGVPHGL